MLKDDGNFSVLNIEYFSVINSIAHTFCSAKIFMSLLNQTFLIIVVSFSFSFRMSVQNAQGLEINIQVSVSILNIQVSVSILILCVCCLDLSLWKYKIRGPVQNVTGWCYYTIIDFEFCCCQDLSTRKKLYSSSRLGKANIIFWGLINSIATNIKVYNCFIKWIDTLLQNENENKSCIK